MENKTPELSNPKKFIVGVDESERNGDKIPLYYLTAALIPEDQHQAFTHAWAKLLEDYAKKINAKKGKKLAFHANVKSCWEFLPSALEIAAQHNVRYIILNSIGMQNLPPELTATIPEKKLSKIRDINKISDITKTPYHMLLVTLLSEFNQVSQQQNLVFEVLCDDHQDYKSWQAAIADLPELLPRCTVQYIRDEDSAVVQLADIAGWYFGRATRDSIAGDEKSAYLTMTQRWIEPFLINPNTVLNWDSHKLLIAKQMNQEMEVPATIKPLLLDFTALLFEAVAELPFYSQQKAAYLLIELLHLMPKFKRQKLHLQQTKLKKIIAELKNWGLQILSELSIKYQTEFLELKMAFSSLPNLETLNDTHRDLIKSYFLQLKPILKEILSNHISDFLKFWVRINKVLQNN